MPITRQAILRGPAVFSFGSGSPTVFYTQGDIIVNATTKIVPLEVAMFGRVDGSDDDMMIEVSFTPSGEITSGLLSLFLPFFTGALYPGTSIFGSTDNPVTIITRAGESLVLTNAQVTTPPPLIAAGTKVFFGAMKITGLIGNGLARSAANALFTYNPSGGSYPGDAGFNITNILRSPFTGKWLTGALPSAAFTVTEASPAVFTSAGHGLINGDKIVITGCTVDTALNGTWYVISSATNTFEISATSGGSAVNNSTGADSGNFVRSNVGDTFASFDTEAGFRINPSVTLNPEKTDGIGTIDMTFQKAEVKVTATPVGPSVADLLALIKMQGTGAARGASNLARGLPLYLSAAGIYVKIPNASLNKDALRFSPQLKRIGEVEWDSNLTLASNVPVPLLETSTSPIT